MVEDVWSSREVKAMHATFQNARVQTGEYRAISMDTTVKACLKIIGQESYRKSKTIRAAAPFDGQDAIRHVLSMRGRTGAVLILAGLSKDDAHTVVACLRKKLPTGPVNVHRGLTLRSL